MGFDEPGGAPYFVGEPAEDPGPLDEMATVRALRLVLSQMLGDEAAADIPERRILAAAHSASDAWRALARQGHSLEAALGPTIASFFLRGKTPPHDEIEYAARIAAELYHRLVPLNALPQAS